MLNYDDGSIEKVPYEKVFISLSQIPPTYTPFTKGHVYLGGGDIVGFLVLLIGSLYVY